MNNTSLYYKLTTQDCKTRAGQMNNLTEQLKLETEIRDRLIVYRDILLAENKDLREQNKSLAAELAAAKEAVLAATAIIKKLLRWV